MPYGKEKSQKDIERLRSYADKEINPDKLLTKKEMKFLELLVISQVPKWKAYDIAYPPRTRINDGSSKYMEYCGQKAIKLLKKPNVKKKYEEMMEDIENKIIEHAVWTKEQAIEKLLERIKSNEAEQNRINETFNAQIDMLLLKIKEADTADKKEKLLHQVMELRKEIRNNTINNNAIIQSVTELNKMHGFNVQELKLDYKEYETDKMLDELSVEELTMLLNKKNE